MEGVSFPIEDERPANKEEREYLARVLGSLGLYDASQDTYITSERVDQRWATIEIDDNPSIVRGST